MKNINILSVSSGCLLLLITMPTMANFIELNTGYAFSSTGGEGTGRGISFQVNSSFSISSVGIYAELLNKSFDVIIYSSSNGRQANDILVSATAITGGTGNGWNDIAINYTFNTDDYYVVNWRASDRSDNWASAIDFEWDSLLPFTVGSVTLIDGVEGADATNFGNGGHPNLRLNISAVPIPAAVWLFGSGLIGLMSIARYKRV